MNRKSALNHQFGFTLVELMVVVAVIGILAAVALPAYQVWIENTKIRTAAESINSGLQKARVEAIKRNVPVQFILGANSAWTIGCVTVTVAPAADCPAIIESRTASDGSSASITTTPAGGTIVFSSLGLVTNAGAFTQLTIDNSFITAADTREMQLRINASGAGRMCDPSVVLTTPPDPRSCY